MSLSERVRPGVEAAPWVCDAIQQMEAKHEALLEGLANLVAAVEFADKVKAASAAGEDTTSTGAFCDSREWLMDSARTVAAIAKAEGR